MTVILAASFAAHGQEGFTRPPAIPLVTHDPYFSVWSTGDTLTQGWPKHWTGATMGMCGLVRIDGKTYRWCGELPERAPALRQKKVTIGLTTTTYEFEPENGVALTIEFGSPIGMCDDAVKSSRSVSYVRATASATDGASHDVRVYMDTSAEWVVHTPDQQVSWSRARVAGMDAVSMGTQQQNVLARAGDYTRIDWGRLYMATPRGDGRTDAVQGDVAISSHNDARLRFMESGDLSDTDDTRMPRAAHDNWPVLAGVLSLGKVAKGPNSGHFLLAYDDGFGIELFERRLRPLWAARGAGIGQMMAQVNAELADGKHAAATAEAERKFNAAAEKVGGSKYGALTRLAYRQVMAGHKIVADWDGKPLMFSKENSSNGCIATVDVIYPASPFFLYHSPEMLKAQLTPLLEYSKSGRWRFPFAPHDLGTYPKANGQVYGGGERTEENQMPVEESGNMLIMLGALAKLEGNADYSLPYLPLLENWAKFLQEHGLDPTNQLCTDDFAGHLARNVNLSAKTVIALGAYAEMLKIAGKSEDAARWRAVAEDFAKRWVKMATDGNSTVLVFDKPGTWSQKYNLIWDRVLGMKLFPQEVFDKEIALYKTKLQPYGLPLDSRRGYTKLDWTVWTASLSGKRADFDAIMAPVYTWVSEGPSRVPLTDWYETGNGETRGMHARTVVGGIWMPLLMEKMGAGLK